MRAELLLLHALPLDGSMWAGQMGLLPGATHAPTLYGFGDRIEDWAVRALKPLGSDRVIVVGCSVGGSCAVEVALAAPERVAALVLIGTKVRHRPDPALRDRALETIREGGLEAAWNRFWAPLLSPAAAPGTLAAARATTLRQSPNDIACGVQVFHSRPDRRGFLAGFTRPVVVVTGADDPAPGPQRSAAQAGEAGSGRLEIVPDCGHYVPLERPGRLNAILAEVIAAVR
ncbi:alpha/beta hydrolase [Rhizobium sp. TRM95111]|uniref:alpha/beta fold hydrolase n=1 Tax=Rhizobium alarense TaxID=2846851 RepID=UPI001F360649|nr:alpha/beta hydrolase [Rhizobium alarense]MCF3641691.1 alpha/beta hydrolase [Rhizobium alarense]